MATTVAILQAVLHADTGKFDRAMGKSESKMQKMGKVAGLAGLAIAGGLAVAFKVGFDEMVASQKVMAQTEAVIESTGGAANVTAGHVDELSQQLLELSGVDDELISSAQNVLLTFRDIRNEAGKGNDIFDQATKATLDFSTAMGLDLNSAALSVGKALNDPVKGMTKLQRQGVTFTASQEKLIKKLVASGDVMGAQKVILAELNKEFGGSAEAAGKTLPAQLNKAKEAFADVAAELVTQLLPAFEVLIGYVSDALKFLKEHPGVAKAVAIAIGVLAGALLLAAGASLLLNLSLLANPVGLVVLGVIALVAGLIVLYRKFELVRTIVNFLRDHWRLLLFAFGLLPGVIMLIVTHFGTLKARAMPVINAIKAAFDKVRTAASAVKDFIVGTLWPAIRPGLVKAKNAVTDIKDAFQSVIDTVSDLIGWIGDLIGKLDSIPSPGDIFGGIKGAIPGFDTGGIVPGPVGQPRLVIAHGGETILPTHRGSSGAAAGGPVVFNNYGFIGTSEREFMRWLDRAQEKRSRRGG